MCTLELAGVDHVPSTHVDACEDPAQHRRRVCRWQRTGLHLQSAGDAGWRGAGACRGLAFALLPNGDANAKRESCISPQIRASLKRGLLCLREESTGASPLLREEEMRAGCPPARLPRARAWPPRGSAQRGFPRRGARPAEPRPPPTSRPPPAPSTCNSRRFGSFVPTNDATDTRSVMTGDAAPSASRACAVTVISPDGSARSAAGASDHANRTGSAPAAAYGSGAGRGRRGRRRALGCCTRGAAGAAALFLRGADRARS